MHPLRSFSKVRSIHSFQGCFCSLEGDKQAVKTISSLLGLIGAKVIGVDASKKALYHLASVMASNFLPVLAEIAQKMFIQTGIQKADAKLITEQLMASMFVNMQNCESNAKAVTGPMTRGDFATLHQHLEALSDSNLRTFYLTLGKMLINLFHHHDPDIQKSLEALFNE